MCSIPDNQNRKYLIDAIRLTGLIKDDNFKHLSIHEEGIIALDRTAYVNVFLVGKENFKDFISQKDELALRNKGDFEDIGIFLNKLYMKCE